MGENMVMHTGVTMDNFQIISALCRQVIKDGASEGALMQIDRLYQSYSAAGNVDEASMLKSLIEKANLKKAMTPVKVELSRTTYLTGQALTRNTKIPVDRDSSAPLAEVVFPEDIIDLDMPILSPDLTYAVDQLIEQWSNVDKLADYGVMPPLSCLFFGMPGTGKTKLAFYVAKKLSLPLVLTRLDGLVSSLLGTSARNISNLFNFANQYNCLLLLDEFDAVAKSRNDKQEVGEIKRIVNTLLQCIDSRSKTGMTIAITNHEVLLDPAVWRRFDIRIFVNKPNATVREKIIERYLPPLKIDPDELRLLSIITEGYSGSDIEMMVNSFKRTVAINGDYSSFIELVKSFTVINAGQTNEFSELIVNDRERDLMKKLYKECGFNQKEIAKLFHTNQSKVSRNISESIDN